MAIGRQGGRQDQMMVPCSTACTTGRKVAVLRRQRLHVGASGLSLPRGMVCILRRRQHHPHTTTPLASPLLQNFPYTTSSRGLKRARHNLRL
jgi:hypothetical protein